MTASLIGLLLLSQGAEAEGPSLKFSGKAIVVTGPGGSEAVEIVQARPKPRSLWSFRSGDQWVVWDSKRGLTIRAGSRVRSSRLTAIPLSPKLFSPEDIAANRVLISAGVRSTSANAVSGAKRIGDKVFLLIRWDARGGRPWLEALVQVDLAEERPASKLIGKFDGLSLADQPVDDRLFLLGERLAIVARWKDGWGVAAYDPASGLFSASQLGQGLERLDRIGSHEGISYERTPYGALRVGASDLSAGNKIDLFETRGKVTLVDESRPLVFRIDRPGGPWLRNSETGAEVRIPYDSRTTRVRDGVLVWWPAKLPDAAVLYQSERWDAVARWSALSTSGKLSREPEPLRSRSGVPEP